MLHHYIIYKPSNWSISSSYLHDSFWEWSVVDQSVCLLVYFSQSVNSLILNFFHAFRERVLSSYILVSLVFHPIGLASILNLFAWLCIGLFTTSYRHCPVKAFCLMIALLYVIPSPIWWIHIPSQHKFETWYCGNIFDKSLPICLAVKLHCIQLM